jgi:glucose-6-phosphate isomerase
MSEKKATAYCETTAGEAGEAGEMTNKDENKMVGHYWLHNSNIALSIEIQLDIDSTIEKILKIAEKVYLENINGQDSRFENALFLCIRESALGPQLICDSLGKTVK